MGEGPLCAGHGPHERASQTGGHFTPHPSPLTPSPPHPSPPHPSPLTLSAVNPWHWPLLTLVQAPPTAPSHWCMQAPPTTPSHWCMQAPPTTPSHCTGACKLHPQRPHTPSHLTPFTLTPLTYTLTPSTPHTPSHLTPFILTPLMYTLTPSTLTHPHTSRPSSSHP